MPTMAELLDKYEYRYQWEKAGFKCVFDSYTGTYRLGLNMEPYRGLCNGMACPCDKAHDLDPTKEAIVEYKGRIWAYQCASAEALIKAAGVLMDVIAMHDKTSQANARLKECIQELGKVIATNLLHSDDCVLANAAAVMRGRTDCTCGARATQKIIEGIIAKANGIV